ncbi:hypothetical protein V6Z11_D11G104900 [Gossypium hirsutum]
MINESSFSKTICSICYEDLKPIVEDLQCISICGHVFHELCLQQWFEYSSSSTKKYNCPVCKQTCVGHNATRLYFQSVGDQTQSVCSQKLIDREEDAESLRFEVKKLQFKVSGLSESLKRHEEKHDEINEQLCNFRDQARKEMTLKNEALREKASIQQKLSSKSEELSKSVLECSRLEQRNLALAKELAVLKLSYKELMAKCNLLGRGEARLQKKLEKAKSKIDKLKKRVQEMETLIEVKDNEVLRALKALKKTDSKMGDNSDYSNAKNSSKEQQMQQSNLELSGISLKPLPSSKKENTPLDSPKAANYGREGCSSTVVIDDEGNMGEDVYIISSPDLKCRNGSRTSSNIDNATEAAPIKPMFNIKMDTPSLPLSEQGNICFSGGLLGPDGTKRHLGKWCKRGKLLGSTPEQGSTKNSGDLIAVGADGRGGRIKVMRSTNQSSMGDKENSVGAKRLKCGAKQNSLPSRGCLQIEHFFGKTHY